MEQQAFDRWKSAVLAEVLAAFAQHPPLRDVLIFKGARILNLRLGEESRQSLDIDSNLDVAFATDKNLQELKEYLRTESEQAVRRYFDAQDPVRYRVTAVRVESRPPKHPHPRGWDGFGIVLSLGDRRHANVRGLPSVEIDVATPEALGRHAVSELRLGESTIRAYSTERIAGEKLRAFLSTLPAYPEKIGRQAETTVRVKDLYDLARIARRHAVVDGQFWLTVGEEFRLACASRYIDCEGLCTFSQELATTRKRYEADPTIPKDIAFEEAWHTIAQVVALFARQGLLPFDHPLPPAPAR
jgi:hypothetical protein